MPVPENFGVDEHMLIERTALSSVQAVRELELAVLRQVASQNFEDDSTFAIKLALEEALTNALRHGNQSDPSKRIHVRYFVDRSRVVIMVRDEGAGFDPAAVPDPTLDENLERPNGRGIMLMRSYMTRVCFCGHGNEIWMLKLRDERRP